MADEKQDLDGVGLDIEAPGVARGPVEMPNLPKPLTLDEKKYLLAVERGDLANVRRMLQLAHRRRHINMNCVDSLGRGALTLAIDGESLEMVELLVIMRVQTRDALLHAINAEFVEAVELLLEHEELIHKEGEPYSWEKMDWNTATFTPDITPLILAAHRNNYEILKILLDRGATLPMPHDIKCGCEECIRDSNEDSLRHSMSRVNEYRALASPSLIALSSNDPILTAFQLSWELRNLAFAEQECKSDYMELRRQCQQFAVDLLHQSRSSQELAIILNHDPDSPPYEDGEHMKLARLELAIDYKQKKFVAHPNIQQLLAAIWYEGLPGFRRKSAFQKMTEISLVALLFPFYCALYMIAPNTKTGKLMRKPFMKFLIHASSYLFFLLILILVSQRAEVQLIQLFGTQSMKENLEKHLMMQRGNSPSSLEWIVLIYVMGFIWEETMEIYGEGIRSYLRNMWNFIDFTRNSLYVAVTLLRIAAYIQQTREISIDHETAFIPREKWDAFDPQLIAEGLFAAANVFSALKLVHMFSINPHLGPLQISLGRMVIDIVKFFFIYSLVLFAFACGLNQLLWYFAELERRKCYRLPGGLPDWDNHGDSCMKWRSFGNLFESSQSLFWASFGGIGIDSFELAGIKTYTRFWGLLMFGSYSVINVIVLLNLLIAMMSNSYAMIDEHSDTEWKFARTRLWMSYFEESATLPSPFNIFPTPKLMFKVLGIRKKDKLRRMSSRRKERQEKERDYRYTAVMRALVWRYVSAKHRSAEESPVTEDDINEVKGEISAMKCEILEVFQRNGMDVSSADTKEKTIRGKKMRIWERRLMKDFHVAPVAAEEEIDHIMTETPPENEDSLARFRRIARLAVLNSSSHKWGQVVQGVCQSSQIGRCNSRESFKNQQNLQKAMEQAQKLVSHSPVPGGSHSASPIPLPETTGSSIMELLKDITEIAGEEESEELDNQNNLKTPKGGSGIGSLALQMNYEHKARSRATTPTPQGQPMASAGGSDQSTRPAVGSNIKTDTKKTETAPAAKTDTDIEKKSKDSFAASGSDLKLQDAPVHKPMQTDGAFETTSVRKSPKSEEGTSKPKETNGSPPAEVTSKPEQTKGSSPAEVTSKPEQTKGSPPVAVTNKPEQTKGSSPAEVTSKPEQTKGSPPVAVTNKPEQTKGSSPAEVTSKPEQTKGSPPVAVTSKLEQTVPDSKSHQTTSTALDDPSPLISTRRADGESPPKVIKRKAPVPASQPESDKSPPSTAAPEEPQAYTILPPPTQPQRRTNEAKPRPTASPERKVASDSQGKADSGQPTLPTFEVTMATTENSTNDSSDSAMVPSSSTERLIGSRASSPAPLRAIKRIDDVNTIKRQPKGGWL